MIVNTTDRTTIEVEALISNLKREVTDLLTDVKNEVKNSVGTVKSIQRGTVASFSGTKDITINPVNPDKCMVIINSGYVAGESATNLSYLVAITETVLTISGNNLDGYSSRTVSWQVIEFY